MPSKKIIIIAVVSAAVGYMLQNYIASIPGLNKLPVLAK